MGGDGRIHGAEYSLVDYNRAGVPLLEIVGKPDLRSAEEARAYVTELRAILVAIGASDGKMEEGSMRVDANVSVRPIGATELGTRCEIKNVNSLRSLGRAIEYEARRQVDLLEAGERVRQETRHWDEEAGRTRAGRSKEEADDYRYFPEPDLVVLDPTAEWIAADQARLCRCCRPSAGPAWPTRPGSPPPRWRSHVERGLDDLALGAIEAGADPARVLTHVEHNLAVDGRRLARRAHFAELVRLEVDGKLTATQAKTVLAEMVETGQGTRRHRRGPRVRGDGLRRPRVDRRRRHRRPPRRVGRVRGRRRQGQDKKLSGFFTGQIMAASKGQADGRAVNMLLNQRRSGA